MLDGRSTQEHEDKGQREEYVMDRDFSRQQIVWFEGEPLYSEIILNKKVNRPSICKSKHQAITKKTTKRLSAVEGNKTGI